MSVHVIYYKDRAKMMRPVLTKDEYLTLRNSRKQQNTVKAVREGDTSKKPRLLQMNYSCLPNDDGTLKGSTRMSNSVGMDIDHVPAKEMRRLKKRILQKKEELGLLMLEKSVRGEGYHLVFLRRPELSQEENLKWASELLEVKYDDGAKDITRVFFTTTAEKEDLLFLSSSLFENTEMVEERGERREERGERREKRGKRKLHKRNRNFCVKTKRTKRKPRSLAFPNHVRLPVAFLSLPLANQMTASATFSMPV